MYYQWFIFLPGRSHNTGNELRRCATLSLYIIAMLSLSFIISHLSISTLLSVRHITHIHLHKEKWLTVEAIVLETC